MTDLEKFYKLAHNVLNDKHKVVKYLDGKITDIFINDGRNRLFFCCDPEFRYFEFYVFVHDQIEVHVDEDNPKNMEDLITYIKSYHFRENILEGIE